MLNTHTENALNVYGFSSNNELAAFIKQHFAESEYDRQDEIFENLRLVQPYVQQLCADEKDLANTISVKKIPARYNKLLDVYRNDQRFSKTFQPHNTEFALVEIDKLVAPQKMVNFDFCQKLIDEMKGATGMKDLIKACLSPDRYQDPIQHLETAGTHIFTSPSSDMRYLGSFVKDLTEDDMEFAGGGLPVAAIISFIGYGVAQVSVLRTPTKMVLHNGFHRVFACRALGIKEVPVVIRDVTNPLLEFPNHINGLSREYLLNSPRPALVKDFFDPKLTIKFKMKRKLKTVKIQVNATALDVPY